MSLTDVADAPGPKLAARSVSLTSVIVAAALVLAAALAWAWLLSSPMQGGGGRGMAGMAMAIPLAPLSLAYLLPAFAMWSIMMVAMMLPPSAPMILLHARVDRASSSAVRLAHTLLFGFAYMLIWTAFSAIAAIAQGGLVASGVVSAAALTIGVRPLASALLIAAALYELTTLKQRCLANCQAPLIFLYRHWRGGAAGALRLGILHGVFCLGCCWALMLLLFVGGVMNLAWVALLGIVVLGQKLAPLGWPVTRVTTAALMLGAIAVLLI